MNEAADPNREPLAVVAHVSGTPEAGPDDPTNVEELFDLLYVELKRLAAFKLRAEREDHTLQPTALVNEVYLRLSGEQEWKFTNRAQFLGMASKAMRRVLTDHARSRNALKRGGTRRAAVDFDEKIHISDQQSSLIEVLDEALHRLSARNIRQARIVEMRFFGGLTDDEIAEIESLSSRTVKRDWEKARAWLRGELGNNAI